jgi:3-methyl-2-oxobutanoate hydroxymethyltransferase
MPKKKRTIPDIVAMKAAGEKITMLTAYEVGLARMIDAAGIDVVLVGDSLGNVVLGYESTVPVTMAEMLHHARAVRRGVEQALLVGDMPFMSYQTSPYDAVVNGGRFLKEAGCDAVKLEGGGEVCEQVRALVRAGIPVMGHIGLTPQTATSLGGYRVQGRDLESARRLLESARALAEAGVFSVVLECVPAQLAELITAEISIPTIGIGAGSRCDGQVLVINDLLGITSGYVPRFVKQYADVKTIIQTAATEYREDVAAGKFPGPEQEFK